MCKIYFRTNYFNLWESFSSYDRKRKCNSKSKICKAIEKKELCKAMDRCNVSYRDVCLIINTLLNILDEKQLWIKIKKTKIILEK